MFRWCLKISSFFFNVKNVLGGKKRLINTTDTVNVTVVAVHLCCTEKFKKRKKKKSLISGFKTRLSFLTLTCKVSTWLCKGGALRAASSCSTTSGFALLHPSAPSAETGLNWVYCSSCVAVLRQVFFFFIQLFYLTLNTEPLRFFLFSAAFLSISQSGYILYVCFSVNSVAAECLTVFF